MTWEERCLHESVGRSDYWRWRRARCGPRSPAPPKPTPNFAARRPSPPWLASRRSPEALATAVGRVAFYGSDGRELGLRLQQALDLRVEVADVLHYIPGAAPTIAPHADELVVQCSNGLTYRVVDGNGFRCP